MLDTIQGVGYNSLVDHSGGMGMYSFLVMQVAGALSLSIEGGRFSSWAVTKAVKWG
ncbi:MAG TPA: hypothetical protein VKR83_07935 [Ktedonobacteraceae bacterium]|nr:hypothetical protein [Ktedonobacteraceae bacterium]